MENQATNHEEVLGKHSGSHHGTPDLFVRDIKLLKDYQLWVQTATEAADETFQRTGYKTSYHRDTWVPSEPDMLKSRLFWRIRSGRKPLPKAPPTAYSCSWYEVIEVPGPHDCWPEEINIHSRNDSKPYASINQCPYDIIEKLADGSYLLEYSGYYRFKAWNGMVPTRSLVDDPDKPGQKKVIDTEHKGCWIEYLGTK